MLCLNSILSFSILNRIPLLYSSSFILLCITKFDDIIEFDDVFMALTVVKIILLTTKECAFYHFQTMSLVN